MDYTYTKKGETITVSPLYSPKGRIGQMVVLTYVSYISESETPFAKYEQPAIFTIIGMGEPDKYGYGTYIVRDSNGIELTTDSSSTGYLYDLQDWLLYKKAKAEEAEEWQDKRYEDLKSKFHLLKDILTAQGQGVRVVTSEQAEKLGI